MQGAGLAGQCGDALPIALRHFIGRHQPAATHGQNIVQSQIARGIVGIDATCGAKTGLCQWPSP